jgi:hypothetical protein
MISNSFSGIIVKSFHLLVSIGRIRNRFFFMESGMIPKIYAYKIRKRYIFIFN